MPTITVDDEGHCLYYEDAGRPDVAYGEIYTTLILVHGSGFHGAVFKRLLPFAPHYKIRLVLVNRRDYPGSSAFSDDEIDTIRHGDEEALEDFAKARGAEYATFIRRFVEQEQIPEISPDGKDGGVVLLAWSSGASVTLPLLSYVDSIPESARTFLEPYLRSYIIFDTARALVGLPSTLDGSPSLLQRTSITPEYRARAFSEYVGAYYTHKSLSSRDINDLVTALPPDHEPGSVERMSVEELRELTHFAAIERTEVGISPVRPGVLVERVRRALFDDELAGYLSKCRVDVIYGERTAWSMVDCAWRLQSMKEKADEAGIKGRHARIVMLPGANHFPHWDFPEETMKFFAELIKS